MEKKKKEEVKDCNYFVGKQNILADEMIQEIIRRLDNSEQANSVFGLDVSYDFKETKTNPFGTILRTIESHNYGTYHIDTIKKINGKWIFALSSDENYADCYAIDGEDDVTTDIFHIETLFHVLGLLEEYEKRGNGIITSRDDWETED